MAASENLVSFSPKAFLKARRPERFSDSLSREETELDRSLLEYHLSSLTTRGQETNFERFARRLCEYEICPNLLPQTGPTGGGDSKVDSETYPVADGLVLAWYVGVGREAAQERWGFAFSAKADWRPKVQSDIAKIAKTNRGYTKAFFVTSQAVPDKKRAECEDALRAKHAIDVRILDRTWILDRVFTYHHEKLAIEELGVTGLSRREVIKGPRDVRRQGELDEAERRIKEALRAGTFGSALVDDALDAADLARSLEYPRAEIEGRYERADELARRYGTSRQQSEVAYQWAWTIYYWFEDYGAFTNRYKVVEERAKGSWNARDLERLYTVWMTLHGTVVRGDLDPEYCSYATRTETLIAELNRLREEEDRPSTSLQAETFLLEVELSRRLSSEKPFDDVLLSLKEVVGRSAGLVGYPLEPLVEVLTEVGEVLEGSIAYSELFETIMEVTSAREGEIAAARLLLNRGERQFLQERTVDAIASLGRCLYPLYKHETRQDIVRALYLCGCAYERIGLPWAARGTLLAAASIATNDLWQYGEITPYQAACYRLLKWVELRLGRLPHILAWHEVDMLIRQELAVRGYDSELLFESETAFKGLVARLLLRTDFFDLKALQKLPDVLDRLGLDIPAAALLHMMGHSDRFKEGAEAVGENLDAFASRCWAIEAEFPQSDSPLLYDRQKVTLRSRIVGCRISVHCETESVCVEMGESILAALESFLATSALDRAMASEPELTMEVRVSHFAEKPITVSVEEREGRPHLAIRCQAFDLKALSIDKQREIREGVFDATVTALAQFVTFKDSERDLEDLFRDERVYERAVAFTSTFGTQGNVLGVSPKTRLSAWNEKDAKTYALVRKEPWIPKEVEGDEEAKETVTVLQGGQGNDPPSELLDPNLRSHEDIETVSIIRMRLWDRAKWKGVGFVCTIDDELPPVLALLFLDRQTGQEIFQHWRKELGKIDVQERMRLAIVRGIDKTQPHAYRVIVGSAPSAVPKGVRFVAFASRIHRMDATTSENLERFLAAYAASGMFYIAPGYLPSDLDTPQDPQIDLNLTIGIHRINVRNAWEIGVRDIDSQGICEDDDPVIPEEVDQAPVLEVIKRIREHR